MYAFNIHAPRNRGIARLALWAALAWALLLAHSSAYAGMSCNGPSPATITFTVPTGTYSTPRDQAVGTLLTPWTSVQSANDVWTSCQGSANTYYGPAFRSVLAASGTYGGYTIYPTSLPGVGLVMRTIVNGAIGAVSPAWSAYWANASSSNFTGWTFGLSMQFAFVKTGPIAGGSTTAIGYAAQVGVDANPYANPSNIASINLVGTATFVPLACTTPDVTVPMGAHKTTELNGIGSTTSAASFNISLNNCPAGMNTIKYEIDPTTSILPGTTSVVALDGSSTATGVGVQLLDGSGAAFPLQTVTTFGGYNGATGGSYTIPMRARYYQTAASVGAGSANTSMTLQMTYQ